MKRENFDFYQNTFSYFKVLKTFLPDKINGVEEELISELYNKIFYCLDEIKIIEIQLASGFLENRISRLPKDMRFEYAMGLYDIYIKPLILNYRNGDFEAVYEHFLCFHNRMIDIPEFKELYRKTSLQEVVETYHRLYICK